MDIVVKRATGGDSKTTSFIEVQVDAPPAVRKAINEEIGQYLVEQTLISMGKSESPVSGGEWKQGLDPAYLKHKKKLGGTGKPDLELTGDLKDAIAFEADSKGIEVGVWGSQAGKADGHNNFSGDSLLPRRQFLPDEGQEYGGKIQAGIEAIVADHLVESVEIDKADLYGIDTKAELYALLKETFGEDMTNLELRNAVMRSPRLTLLLEDEDLLDLL